MNEATPLKGLAVSDVEPGSTHDLTATRRTGFLGALHATAALLGLPTLADKGYDGAGAGVLTPTKGGNLHPDNLTRNQLIGCLRAKGEGCSSSAGGLLIRLMRTGEGLTQ